ncbi:MAG: phosphoglucomutase, alpha-D-glucose phosphate-specific, partial [Thermodesulfobacteriota bacterium]|nr:phosphoglucomutase, alpha-D-glucose phosphate-specific [Thermodesulfobacteriota bacterium]
MALNEFAGKPAPREMLINVPRLLCAYYTLKPDASDPAQRVSFGTSGHRGSSFEQSFNEAHILAVSQAICEHRASKNITGPLFMGMDTHALSEAAFISALEVFAANGVSTYIQEGLGYTPTPVISHAILTWNRDNKAKADGVVITPSHNPPNSGGFKYNPPEGGPADTQTTTLIQDRANELLRAGLSGVKRISCKQAFQSELTRGYDYVLPYVKDLKNVVDMEAISRSGLKIGVDPMGGSGIGFWDPIAEMYGLDIQVVNRVVDPTFAFMTVDKDGKIRMDCSSLCAMAGLINLKDDF